MSAFRISTLLVGLGLASRSNAHGFVTGIVADGIYHGGYIVTSHPYIPNPPEVVGWSTTAKNLGFVGPEAFSSADIICHQEAEPGALAAKVRAGGTVELQWNSWPESHHGPVIDYLANCNGDCATVGKSALRFFKIGEAGLVDGSSGPGKWASDDLIANNASWSVTIPVSISPGNYVLRHEIIALHSAGHEQGAQNYPQCVNLEVTGDGIESPQGVAGTQLYKATDPGIRFDIYRSMDSYPIPGPPIFRDGDSSPPSSAPPASVPPSAVATETSTETKPSISTS